MITDKQIKPLLTSSALQQVKSQGFWCYWRFFCGFLQLSSCLVVVDGRYQVYLMLTSIMPHPIRHSHYILRILRDEFFPKQGPHCGVYGPERAGTDMLMKNFAGASSKADQGSKVDYAPSLHRGCEFVHRLIPNRQGLWLINLGWPTLCGKSGQIYRVGPHVRLQRMRTHDLSEHSSSESVYAQQVTLPYFLSSSGVRCNALYLLPPD